MTTRSHPAHVALSRKATLLLVAALALVVAVPLVINAGAAFEGTDASGAAAVAAAVPGYRPWIGPIWEPPSSEIESMLFALQAAAGGAIAGYVFGLRRGRAEGIAERKGKAAAVPETAEVHGEDTDEGPQDAAARARGDA